MKILFLNVFDSPVNGGGLEVTLWTLMRSLTMHGHECVLLATSEEKGLHVEERDGVRIWRAGIRNLYWPGDKTRKSTWKRALWHAVDVYNPLMAAYVRQVIRDEQPDVISMHNLSGWSSAIWKEIKKSGIPCVQVLHDQYLLCPKSSMFNRGKNCLDRCSDCRMYRLPHGDLSSHISAVVGVSQFVLDRHLNYGYFRGVAERLVIHNVRDPAVLGVENIIERQGSGVRVGYIGRLDTTKGVDRLITAFKGCAKTDMELWIAGIGSADYESSLRYHAGDAQVLFMGRVNPMDFFSQIDVLVVPSLWNDTLPGVVFEGFAFGKPVIASDRGGISEMITHGVNGLLFNPDNPIELTLCLEKLYSDDQLRHLMGQNAKASSRQFLDVSTWVARYLDLYGRLTGISFVEITSAQPSMVAE